MPARTLAQRTVTGVIAGMVVATAAATAVGFWLSYAGLQAFALHAGLRGAEAWAWPGSLDLFILAGESGVTLAALPRQADGLAARIYLGIGLRRVGVRQHPARRHRSPGLDWTGLDWTGRALQPALLSSESSS